MQDIKKLFPSDHNPFYVGFGNRDTDELSYRKIGIPKGKIFIINPKVHVFCVVHMRKKRRKNEPKPVLGLLYWLFNNLTLNWQGEVAISHCIDVRSYTSLHTLVNDMFPPTSLVEQVNSISRLFKYHAKILCNYPWFVMEPPVVSLIFQYLCRKILIHGIFGKCHCWILSETDSWWLKEYSLPLPMRWSVAVKCPIERDFSEISSSF